MANFDEESGQVYTETHARVRSRHHSDWIGELKTPSLARNARPSRHGARSLAVMASTRVASQFRDLSADHFNGIPWRVASGIWKQIVKLRRESFHTWRVLAAAYPIEMFENRYHLHIRQPSLSPEAYFSGLGSTAISWLVCLRISPKEVSVADLVLMANVPNLAVLDLSDGQVAIDMKTSSFNERVLRTWAEIAARRKGFFHLRVLLLGWQDLDIWLFKYLPYFPNLSQVIITDSQNLNQRNRKDWEVPATAVGYEARHAKRSAKSLRPVLDDPDFHKYSVSGFLLDQSGQNDGSGGSSHKRRPILECWLGTPRKWTHILEDFPGTRTIYFDRVKSVEPQHDIFNTRPQPNPDALSKTLRSGLRTNQGGRPTSQRSSQSTFKPRKPIPGLADVFRGLS